MRSVVYDLLDIIVSSENYVAALQAINEFFIKHGDSFSLHLSVERLLLPHRLFLDSPYIHDLRDWRCSCFISDRVSVKKAWCSKPLPGLEPLSVHRAYPLSVGSQLVYFVWVKKAKERSISKEKDLKLLMSTFANLMKLSQDLTKNSFVLMETQRRSGDLFEKIPVGFYRSTPEGRILSANLEFARMLGFNSVDEVLRVDVRKLYLHPELREQWKGEVTRYGLCMGFECALRKVNGEVIWVSDSARVVKEPDGTYYEGIIQDITNRKVLDSQKYDQNTRFRNQHKILAQLLAEPALSQGKLEEILSKHLHSLCTMMNIDRVTLWRFPSEPETLICVTAYDRFPDGNNEKDIVCKLGNSQLFQELEKTRVLEILDTQADERTREFGNFYWQKVRTSTALIGSIRIQGSVWGMITLEHRDGSRIWYPDEKSFVTELADLIAQGIPNQEIQEKAKVLEAINHLITVAQTIESADELLHVVLRGLLELTQSDWGVIRVNGDSCCIGIETGEGLKILKACFARGNFVHQPLLLHDFSLDFSEFSLLQEMRIGSLVFMAIPSPTEQLGGILLASRRIRIWNSELLEIIRNLGAEVTLTLHRLYLDQEARQRAKLLENLQEVSEQLNAPKTVPDTIEIIGKHAMKIFNAEKGAVFTPGGEGVYCCAWNYGTDPEILTATLEFLKFAALEDPLNDPQPFLVSNIKSLKPDAPLGRFRDVTNLGALMLWPVTHEKRRQAWIGLYFSNPHPCTLVENEIMAAFVRQAGTALLNARLLAQVQEMAQQDTLTGLFNRRHLETTLEQALVTTLRGGIRHALLLVDIDNFRSLNDTLGQPEGDRILQAIGRFLPSTLNRGDVIARLSGDNFCILSYNTDETAALELAERIKKAVQAWSYSTGRGAYTVTVSIGVAMLDANVHDVQEALARADAAVSSAKRMGRNNVRLYREEDAFQSHVFASELALLGHLRRAMETDGLRLYFQPIVDLEYGAIHSYEALLRLPGEGHLVLPANRLMSVAHHYALTPDIDTWVIEKCLTILKNERNRRNRLKLNVNVSGQTLEREEYLQHIESRIQHAGLDPQTLVMEITESVAINQIMNATDFIFRMHRLGISFALDDFGIGFSTFGHIKHIPVDYVKIDMNFIRSLSSSTIDRILVQSMHQACDALGLKTVAEGVENNRVLQFLKDMNIPYGQGYFLGRPKPGF